MDVRKCIVPVRHGGTLNSRQAANPLVRLVEGVERWEPPDNLQVFPLKIGVETSQIAMADDRRHLALCHEEFHGSRSGLCRSGGITTTYVLFLVNTEKPAFKLVNTGITKLYKWLKISYSVSRYCNSYP
ncbi:uncharacterized protein TNCV_3819591 [Trichonephila clavipes]|nr:uncharacterized protein TNCV_3819591 [Trichonephila clavipes]